MKTWALFWKLGDVGMGTKTERIKQIGTLFGGRRKGLLVMSMSAFEKSSSQAGVLSLHSHPWQVALLPMRSMFVRVCIVCVSHPWDHPFSNSL